MATKKKATKVAKPKEDGVIVEVEVTLRVEMTSDQYTEAIFDGLRYESEDAVLEAVDRRDYTRKDDDLELHVKFEAEQVARALEEYFADVVASEQMALCDGLVASVWDIGSVKEV